MTTITWAPPHQSGLDGRLAHRKPLFSARYKKARIRFYYNHLKDSEKCNSLVWGDQNQRFVWRTPGSAHHLHNTIARVRHGGGSIMPRGCLSAARTAGQVAIEGKMKAANIENLHFLSTTFEWAGGSPSNKTGDHRDTDKITEWLQKVSGGSSWMAEPDESWLQSKWTSLERPEGGGPPPFTWEDSRLYWLKKCFY